VQSLTSSTHSMNKACLLRFLCLICMISPKLFSQSRHEIPGINHPVAIQKLYLHTDRSYYFPGDTVWFKGYYLDGISQKLDPGFCTMYLDLINPEGVIILNQEFGVEQGMAMGQFSLTGSLRPGKYLLRAYTDLQRQIGEEAFFYKTLELSKLMSARDEVKQASIHSNQAPIDLSFLPEGGCLLQDRINTVGIKTVDSTGNDVAVKGRILDSQGLVLCDFQTVYQGMDTVCLMPQKGKSYHIELESYPEFVYHIQGIQNAGIKLECTGENEEEIFLRVTSNAAQFHQKDYVFAIMHRGRLVFDQRFTLKDSEFPIKLEREALPAGINRLILLNASLIPLSERLCFSSLPEINRVDIQSDQYAYSTRSPVEITLHNDEHLGEMTWSELSLSVINEHANKTTGEPGDMLSWLLVDSELKGKISSPSNYFVDDSLLRSRDKLNLLMLTHGWSRYLWNNLPEADQDEKLQYAEGISLTGKVRKAFSKKPVRQGLVTCNIFSDKGYLSDSTFTDSQGNFRFPDLYFLDTVAIFLQGYNRRGKRYTEVYVDPLWPDPPQVSPWTLPEETRFDEFPVRLYQQQYYNERALKEYTLKTGSILLEEVTLVGKYKGEYDGLPRIYSKPRDSFKVTKDDLVYQNVGQFLKAKLGALLYAPKISFGGESPYLFLLNGIPTDYPDAVMDLSLSQVEVVEFLRHYDVTNVGMFGTRGASGIVSVFTKKGGEAYTDDFVQGTLSSRICGYSSYREFYSPKYTSENLHTEKPDQRITLYWNPHIRTKGGEAHVSFFTSDDIARYRIVVEGITQSGEICLGGSDFVVSSTHPGL